MSFCQQNVPQVDTWQHALRTKSARTVQIAGVRKQKGCNVFSGSAAPGLGWKYANLG